MVFEFNNWYNDPFNDDKSKKKTVKKDLRVYHNGKLSCRHAHDGRKQKACEYYYRNAKTRKCLFLKAGYRCIAAEV